MDKEITIEVEHWEYSCSDGCCYDCGKNIKVNNLEFEENSTHYEDMLKEVLESLGYKVELVFK